MGITTVLQDETGTWTDSVEDPTNVLHRILPTAGDERYQCLSLIDWYGDTVFNYLQASRFLQEWLALAPQIPDGEARRVFDGIRTLAERMQSDRHMYLKFYGD